MQAGSTELAASLLLDNLRHLFRYRALIQSLVARDLTARYRGSLLGVFWSFVNPLLLLLVYTFVFTVVMPARGAGIEHVAVFMFCGILPWTWFQSSLVESSNVLISSGNLIRKVLFPAEVLPLVSVLSGLVHFCLGLPILAAFLAYYDVGVEPRDLVWLPVVMFVQLLFTAGLGLLLSALTVHFRDVRDLLTNVLYLWFFATPILYPLSQAPPGVRPWLRLNPFTHLAAAYQEILYFDTRFVPGAGFIGMMILSVGVFAGGYFVFDRLRDTLAEEV
jgi:ABC-type polysaccharide/polyol phosphate export permease